MYLIYNISLHGPRPPSTPQQQDEQEQPDYGSVSTVGQRSRGHREGRAAAWRSAGRKVQTLNYMRRASGSSTMQSQRQTHINDRGAGNCLGKEDGLSEATRADLC